VVGGGGGWWWWWGWWCLTNDIACVRVGVVGVLCGVCWSVRGWGVSGSVGGVCVGVHVWVCA
jgi:hypothetical protein